MGLFSGFDSINQAYNNQDKVGGAGLFGNMSKGDFLKANTLTNVLGGVEDQFNTAKDLQLRAALAPSEAMLHNHVDLPVQQNRTRQFVGNLLAQDRQMQNSAESKDAVDRQKRLEQYQMDTNKAILDAINRK